MNKAQVKLGEAIKAQIELLKLKAEWEKAVKEGTKSNKQERNLLEEKRG